MINSPLKSDSAKYGRHLLSPLTVGVSTELDALGDELLMDDDSSYLDEASTAPSIPEGMPGDKSTNRVRHSLRIFQFHMSSLVNLQSFQ